MQDLLFKHFERTSDEKGQRVFSGFNTGVCYQINCKQGGLVNTLVVIALFIDCSFIKSHIYIMPIFRESRLLLLCWTDMACNAVTVLNVHPVHKSHHFKEDGYSWVHAALPDGADDMLHRTRCNL
jgi:hypothetical protein